MADEKKAHIEFMKKYTCNSSDEEFRDTTKDTFGKVSRKKTTE